MHVSLLTHWKGRQVHSPLPYLIGFSSHLSTANEITELLWVSFSDFSLNCFSLWPSMHTSGKIPSQIIILSHITCPHITAQLARLLGWSRQTNFRPSTLMQSNKGAWCHVAQQPARRICRITLDLLVIKKKKRKKKKAVCNPTCCHQWSCVLVSVISINIGYLLWHYMQRFLCYLKTGALFVSVIMPWVMRECWKIPR